MQATILLAHGSSDPSWCKPVQQVAQQLARRAPEMLVRCAYLERCQPDLAGAAAALVALGATQITLLPLFFGVGKHLREDLPRLLEPLRTRYAQVQFLLLPSVGENPRLIDLLAQIALDRADAR